MHLHLNRGKRSLVLDLRTEAGVDIPRSSPPRPTSSSRPCGPAPSTGAASGFDDLRAVNPKIVFCTISGYGMTGPYRDYPSHGVAYDTWAGIVSLATDDEGFAYIPEHASIGIHAGPLFGALGILAAVDPCPCHRRGLAHRHRAVRRGGRHGLAAQRDMAGLRAARRARSPGNKADGFERRAPGTAGMVEGVRYQVYETSDAAPRAVHGVGAGLLEELLRGRRPDRTSSSAGRARSTPTTPAATASSSVSCATSSARRLRRSGSTSVAGSTRPSHRSTRPRRCSTTPSSPIASRCSRRPRSAPTSSSHRCTSSARSWRTRPRRPPSDSTPRTSCAPSSDMTTIGSHSPGTGGIRSRRVGGTVGTREV